MATAVLNPELPRLLIMPRQSRWIAIAVLIGLAGAVAGCGSDHDALMSEKVARAENAARRAVKAQAAAERAARAVTDSQSAGQAAEETAVPADDEPEEEADSPDA